MKTRSLFKQQDTSGSKAAALIGAGIGLATLGFSDTLLELFQPLLNLLGHSQPHTSSLGVDQAAVGTTGWLGSWAFLHQRWNKRRKSIRSLIVIGMILLVLMATGFLDGFTKLFK